MRFPSLFSKTSSKKDSQRAPEPPVLISVDRSSATILMKSFASTGDVATGTEYRTASMDFTKAQVALENSALSSVITADFSPKTITLTFPDGYVRTFSRTNALPSVTHVVLDPRKGGSSLPATTGTINVTSSPSGAEVYIDDVLVGNSPGNFGEIPPGSHVLKVAKDGFYPSVSTITIVAGQTIEERVILSYGTPVAPPSQQGFHPLPGFTLVPVLLVLIFLLIIRSGKKG